MDDDLQTILDYITDLKASLESGNIVKILEDDRTVVSAADSRQWKLDVEEMKEWERTRGLPKL